MKTYSLRLMDASNASIRRVQNLVRIYQGQPSAKGRGRKQVFTADILRAAVVFLHAAFEEMCRTVERELLPHAPSDVLDDVPLSGCSDHGRPRKVLLGELLPHKQKSVATLLQESVDEHLRRQSYSTVEEFCGFLRRMGFQKELFESGFGDLATLMKRRHQIVHEGDANPESGPGHQKAQAISQKQVSRWISCVWGIHGHINSEYCRRNSEIR